ncbi:MAG: SurA N-terminal domain-containing protein [Myxococcales bacterium]|nr:SurA N-terminal domain-containing protein [Myxococcales bacterium]
MLEKMRTHSRNWLISFLFAIIIVVFALNFGPGFDQLNQTGCIRKSGYAATVNGEPITRQLFMMRWQNYLQARQIPPQFIQALDLKGRLMTEMIDVALLAQAAKRYGVQISDDEVQQQMIESPEFQNKDKIFDPDRFRRLVNYYGLTTEQYQEQRRQLMQADRMRGILTAGVKISDAEVLQSYKENNNKVKIAYLSLPAKGVRLNVKVSDKDIEAFLKGKGAEEKLKKLYNKRSRQYERRIGVSHILIKVDPKKANDVKYVAEKRKKIDEIRAKALKDSKNFAKLAGQYSEGPTRVKGGDLGMIDTRMMVPPFTKAAFALKKVGEVSDVVKTNFGFHIIKLNKEQAGRQITDAKLRKELARDIVEQERSENAALELAKGFLAEAQKGVRLEDIAKRYKKEKAAKKATSKPVASRPAKKQAPYFAELAGKVVVKSPAAFTRFADNVPGIGSLEESKDLVHAAFSLKTKELAAKPFAVKDKIFVIQLRKRISPDMKEFGKEKEQLRERMLNRKKTLLVQSWLENMRNTADIYKNKALLSYGPNLN